MFWLLLSWFIALVLYLAFILGILFRALSTENSESFEAVEEEVSMLGSQSEKLESVSCGTLEKSNVVSQETLETPKVEENVVTRGISKPETPVHAHEPFSLEAWLRQVSKSIREGQAQSLRAPSQAVYKEVESKAAEPSLGTARPTKEQLATLKQKLGIEKGSVQFKDGSIYLVTSNRETKKHTWQKLGRWKDLAHSLTTTQLEGKVS